HKNPRMKSDNDLISASLVARSLHTVAWCSTISSRRSREIGIYTCGAFPFVRRTLIPHSSFLIFDAIFFIPIIPPQFLAI
ncbi:hypothetical protein, partial [uncultured Dialister sp.]|uniref:hypothetical protein n=1 Tax=uncultured Dialister sp. TaxID=278064 RepID=UPI0025E4A939